MPTLASAGVGRIDAVVVAGVQDGVWPNVRLRGGLLQTWRLADALTAARSGLPAEVPDVLDRRRAARQRDQLALGREAEDLVLEEFELGVLEELLRAVALCQQVDRAAQPLIGAAFIGIRISAAAAGTEIMAAPTSATRPNIFTRISP